MDKIDLNAPAFGSGAQKVTPAVVDETPAVEVKPVVEAPVVEAEAETQVPYSRFKKFHDAAKEAEAEADYWRQEAQRRQDSRPPVAENTDSELPPEWVTLYGDSEASSKAWQVQQRMFSRMQSEAIEAARNSVQSEREAEVERTEQNMERLDDNFEDLSAMVGRNLSDAEQSAVLDIVDEYTPKDRSGNYAGEILPFDKAWEIYELKNQATKAPTIAQRNNVAGILGSQSQGAPSEAVEANKNWNPLDWNAYKRRI